MKFYSLFLTMFVLFNSFSQDVAIDEKTGKYSKGAVVEVENITKDDMYMKALEWIALNYKDAGAVIQFQDKETGKIIVKGAWPSSRYMKEGLVKHTLTLAFKDGRFKYDYTDFVYTSVGSGELPFEGSIMNRKGLIEDVDYDSGMNIKSLTEHIQNSSSEEEW